MTAVWGPNPYSIMELGMVEDILREDGEGRRALFEEAGGEFRNINCAVVRLP